MSKTKAPGLKVEPENVLLEPSPFALVAGYKRPTRQQLFTAATGSRKKVKVNDLTDDAFPGPLVLPGDDLAEDPKYPPQSFKSWQKEPLRMVPTAERKTIYVAAAPEIDDKVNFVEKWTLPRASSLTQSCLPPTADVVIQYLQAFYHGFGVKMLPFSLRLTEWDEGQARKKGRQRRVGHDQFPEYLGLEANGSIIRIRCRHLNEPESAQWSAYQHQLNLNDILDCAIEVLPEDAFAILLLVDHDIYEDENDDFCCGRAYGGSRVSVVSSAQYNPYLDDHHAIKMSTSWPACHHKSFVRSALLDDMELDSEDEAVLALKREDDITQVKEGMSAANSRAQLEKHRKDDSKSYKIPFPSELQRSPFRYATEHYQTILNAMRYKLGDVAAGPSTFNLRLCRTASHELGHCFGMDHCTWYACAMQGTTSTREDSRQPPYLCPVCESKVAYAASEVHEATTKVVADESFRAKWSEARHMSMLNFCSTQEDEGFGALAAWTDSILRVLRKDE